MVKTWSDSWFSEDGLRVLYTLPRGWTEEILPVKITPAPQELVRVMVGRAEVFSRALEETLRQTYRESCGPGRLPAVAAKLAELHLGRFARAALVRLDHLETQGVTDRINARQGALNSMNLGSN